MAINNASPDVKSVALTTWSGLVSNINPIALPQGSSPDCSDCSFLPSGVFSRACFQKALATSLGVVTVSYGKSYVDSTGIIRDFYLDAAGNFWMEIIAPSNLAAAPVVIFTTTPGASARSITANGREYVAIHNGLHGADIPYQITGLPDGTVQIDRVTQDGPGAPPQVISLALPSVSMALDGTAPTLTIAGIFPTNKIGGAGGYYPVIGVFVSTSVSTIQLGQPVTISGTSGGVFAGTYTVIAFPDDGSVQLSAYFPDGTLSYVGGGTLTIGPGGGTTLSRFNNVVTALTATAHQLQVGYRAQISGVPAASVGGGIASIVINNEDNPGIATVTTNAAHFLVPELFVSLTGIVGTAVGTSISSMTRAGGIVTVLLSGSSGLTPGASFVAVSGITTASFNVGATQVLNVTTSTNPGDTFTYAQTDADAVATVGAGTITLNWPVPDTPTPTFFQVVSAPTAKTFQVQVNSGDGAWTGGTASYAWDGKFYVASILAPTTASKTTLAGAMATTTTPTALVTSGAGLVNGETIQIGSEQMVITAGGGTGTLTVTRGANGTPPATHLNGAAVLLVTFGFTYQQYGPNTTSTTIGTVTPYGQAAPGQHQVQVFFIDRQGGTTTASPPVNVIANGGQYFSLTNIPIGPSPHIIARAIAFTGADGAYFFYIPSPPQENGQIVGTATQINDNVTTSAVFDFGDPTLFAALGISIPGNNLANQVVIDGALWFGYYGSRLLTGGQRNVVGNLLNRGFDGGFLPNAATTPTGWISDPANTVNETTLSAGIDAVTNSISVTSGVSIANGNVILIDSEAMLVIAGGGTGTLGVTRNVNGTIAASHASGAVVSVCLSCLANGRYGDGWLIGITPGIGPCGILSQSAYEDYAGAPILTGNTQYRIRVWLKPSVLVNDTVFSISLTSASTSFSSVATVFLNGASTSGSWFEASFTARTPNVIPTDLLLIVSAYGAAIANTLLVDEISIIYSQNPVSLECLGSYVNNPEGFDDVTGVFAPQDDTHQVMGLFIIRSALYMLTLDPNGRLHETSQGDTEPAKWAIGEVASNCGLVGVAALTQSQADDSTASGGEEWAAWYSSDGPRIFGGSTPDKIAQEIQRPAGLAFPGAPPDLGALNVAAQLTTWALNDPQSKTLYFGIPANAATAPSVIWQMSYLGMDSAEQIASSPPVHRALSGKLVTSDLARKWSPWQRAMNGAALMFRQANVVQPVFFNGNGLTPNTSEDGAYGNVYLLNPGYYTDDDYGQFYPYYTTYAFVDRDTEQQMDLGGGLKTVSYSFTTIAGVGLLPPQLLYNFLNQPWSIQGQNGTESLYALSLFPPGDLEWSGIMAQGYRFFFKVAPIPNPAGTTAKPTTDVKFSLSSFTLCLRKKNRGGSVSGRYNSGPV